MPDEREEDGTSPLSGVRPGNQFGCHFCFFGASSPSEIQRKVMRGSAPMTWSFCPFEWQYSPALSTAAFTASVLCDMPPSDRLTPMV